MANSNINMRIDVTRVIEALKLKRLDYYHGHDLNADIVCLLEELVELRAVSEDEDDHVPLKYCEVVPNALYEIVTENDKVCVVKGIFSPITKKLQSFYDVVKERVIDTVDVTGIKLIKELTVDDDD